MRKSGWYWVKIKNSDWVISYWDGFQWYWKGCSYLDKSWEEIDKNRIEYNK